MTEQVELDRFLDDGGREPMDDLKIHYSLGDATRPMGTGRRMVVHICNNYGGWSAGFVLAVTKAFPQAEFAYRQGSKRLGTVGYVPIGNGITICNMIAQTTKVDYAALETCLNRIAERIKMVDRGMTVHMPRIGCGLGGGDWSEVEPIIERTLIAAGIPVFVYDWEGE